MEGFREKNRSNGNFLISFSRMIMFRGVSYMKYLLQDFIAIVPPPML